MIETSRERPLVSSRTETSVADQATTPAAISASTAQAAATMIRVRRSESTNVTAAVITNSVAKLDCEYEKNSPVKSSAITGSATARRTRSSQSAVSSTTIAITRKRP